MKYHYDSAIISFLYIGRVMLHQKAFYLQEMGITRWQVRKPALFCTNENNSTVDLSRYDLLLLCSPEAFLHPLTSKILSAFNLHIDKVYHCSMDEFENHQGSLPLMIWSTLGPINQPYGHQLLTSPSIEILAENPDEKKALWEQFCACKSS